MTSRRGYMKLKLHLLGKTIKKYREKQEMTQEYVAMKIGKTSNYISELECGRKGLKLSTLIAIANLLEVSCDELLRENLSHRSQAEDRILMDKIARLDQGQKATIENLVEYMLSENEKQ